MMDKVQQISSKRSTPWSQRIRAHRLPLYFIKLKSAVNQHAGADDCQRNRHCERNLRHKRVILKQLSKIDFDSPSVVIPVLGS